ncbi:MAG: RNA-binding protein [Firmicutes bacterium HGW-Firmicutes-1]|jgi:ribosomal protein L14E/L6E/L27E|nr:MAG: RNA-binding protein [Firmicutes bacterium HGW-Firmicutes-1]
MDKFQYGQIIKSKAGRDQDKIFVIIDIQDEYVYLVDGHFRRIENPKKKKLKHIQPMNIVIETIKHKIENEEKLTNADIRRELIVYQKGLDHRKEV